VTGGSGRNTRKINLVGEICKTSPLISCSILREKVEVFIFGAMIFEGKIQSKISASRWAIIFVSFVQMCIDYI